MSDAERVLMPRGLYRVMGEAAYRELVAAVEGLLAAERERLAALVVDVPEPPADMPPRDAQTVALELYRRAIRRGGG